VGAIEAYQLLETLKIQRDEFVVVLNDINSPLDAGKLAQKLLQNARELIVVGKNNLAITLSIGIALYPGDGDNAPLLLKRADEVLYMSNNKGRDCYQFITPVKEKQPARSASLKLRSH
jgi:diguanylate cyclase (GGDEF)-like protein